MSQEIELTYTPQQYNLFFEVPIGTRFVVVPKGRRFGATKGAANACIEWCLDGCKILWGDTINGNIDRYFERYIQPELSRAKIVYKYNKQSKQLNIGNGFVDFRSADNPENWEGFGYDKIILNEAGIILKNKYLYTNAVLPMMMDSHNSILYALGVPKGKILKNNEEHPFYTLAKAAINKQKGYHYMKFSSYDNPLLSGEDIQTLEDEIKRMNPAMVQQEIYGEFVDGANMTLWTPQLIIHTDTIPRLIRILTAIDPSGSKTGDEVGIVSGGISETGNIYILSDRSGGYTPNEWGTISVNEVKGLKGDAIVAERNYGGDMVKANITNVDKLIRVIEVVASRGKDIRAEPVVGVYEQGRVYHAHGLNILENEMLTWVPGVGKSPNRVDALVWLVSALLESKNTSDPNKIKYLFR